MRLIDAEALIDELENDRPLNWTDSPGEIQEQVDWDRFIGMVNVANTIDVVPVVRCGECKYSSLPSELTQRYGKPGTLTCHSRGPCNRRNVNAMDFCSYGERKEGADCKNISSL